MRLSLLAAILFLCATVALGHEDDEGTHVDPALKRYLGQITALGTPDAKGEIYSFRAKRLYADTPFVPDELRGWRLTILAGKRYANVFQVRSNSGDEITVTADKGSLNGIKAKDVFVVEHMRPGAAKH
jgi:hypothetical protein